AVWCAVMALVPIRAYEPALTFAISSPLTVLLIKLRQRTVKSSDPVKSSDARSEQATSRARYLHFTIRDLFLATVVIGMTLAGLLHIIAHIQQPAIPASNFICITAVTFAAYNCYVSQRRLIPGLLLLIAIVASAAAVPLIGSQPETYEALSLINVGFHSS